VGRERTEQYDLEGKLHNPAEPGGRLRMKQHLDETKGAKVSNMRDDFCPTNSRVAECLGLPDT